jgi:hypothetical protein
VQEKVQLRLTRGAIAPFVFERAGSQDFHRTRARACHKTNVPSRLRESPPDCASDQNRFLISNSTFA